MLSQALSWDEEFWSTGKRWDYLASCMIWSGAKNLFRQIYLMLDSKVRNSGNAVSYFEEDAVK